MLATDLLGNIMEYASMMNSCGADSEIRICVDHHLYDIGYIDASIDMDTNKSNIVIHVKEK